MFVIKSNQPIHFPGGFKLRKGDNKLKGRDAVPERLWPALERFKKAKILDFEDAGGGAFDAKAVALTEAALEPLGLQQLRDVAAARGIDVSQLKSKAETRAAILATKP